jgi:hypothetical protein
MYILQGSPFVIVQIRMQMFLIRAALSANNDAAPTSISNQAQPNVGQMKYNYLKVSTSCHGEMQGAAHTG